MFLSRRHRTGDVPGTHGFHGGLAGGELAPVVAAAFGVVAQLDNGHDVQGRGRCAGSGPGETATVVVTGRMRRWGGAAPRREGRAAGESGDVPRALPPARPRGGTLWRAWPYHRRH